MHPEPAASRPPGIDGRRSTRAPWIDGTRLVVLFGQGDDLPPALRERFPGAQWYSLPLPGGDALLYFQ